MSQGYQRMSYAVKERSCLSADLPEANRELDDCLTQVAENIYSADRALALIRAIGSNADAINAAGSGHPFKALQAALADQFVLCTAKVFEPPSKQYRILSLRAGATALHAAPDTFRIVNRAFLLGHLAESSGTHAELPDHDLTTLLAEQVLKALPDLTRTSLQEHDNILDALKARRDKVIAHSEDVERADLPRWTWQEGIRLLDDAKRFTGLLSRGYTHVVHTDDAGTFFLSSDAGRVGRSLERFLSQSLDALSREAPAA